MGFADLPIVGGAFGGVGGGNLVNFAIAMIFSALIIGGLIGGLYWWYRVKKIWNLKVEFKMPRSDGNIVLAEWGKGCYDARKGVVFVQRKGKKKSALKPFDIKQFLQGTDVLTVLQVGIDEYVPILPQSFEEVTNERGEKANVLNVRVDSSEGRAWRNSFERESKGAYSLGGLLKENATFVAIGLVIFLWGIQFLVIYNAVK